MLEYIPSDKEPDERIYWVLVLIPVLFFLVGVFYLCWNRCGRLKPYCSLCCTICKCCSISSICCNICCAFCTKLEKEDLNPYYGADLDEATSVAEVACVIVFIRLFSGNFNIIHDVTNCFGIRRGTQIPRRTALMQAREQE